LKAQDAALVVGLRGQLVRRAMPPSSYLQGRRVMAWVYLPPDYQSSARRYRVAYLLHGAPGSVRDPFVNARVHRVAERLIVAKQIEPLILVGWDGFGPRGLEDVTDFLDRRDGKYQMESFVTRELVPFIDRAFRTQARPQSRALIGFSAGGYGAANLGFRHPELFGVTASHAGFFDPNDDAHTISKILGPRASNTALWNANDPILRAREVPHGVRLHFYLDCGRDDPLLSEFKKMQAELKARGVDFKAQIVDGAHDWTFLTRHYADSLRFCDERFREMASK
jgi:enterochelin esterase-like enzyme